MKVGSRAVPTTMAVALTALTLASDAVAGGHRADDWKAVAGLQPGAIITVTARGAAPIRCLAAFADSQTLAVVRFIHAQSPERVQRALRDLPPPALPVLPAADVRVDAISFVHGEVFDGGIKVADVVALPKDNVIEVDVTRRAGHGSRWGAVIGAGAGAFAAMLIAPPILLKPCGASCSDEAALFYVSAIGLPVGGGLLGYYAGRSGETDEVIYRAPADRPLVLDEAAWQRIRNVLPPSLCGDAAGK